MGLCPLKLGIVAIQKNSLLRKKYMNNKLILLLSFLIIAACKHSDISEGQGANLTEASYRSSCSAEKEFGKPTGPSHYIGCVGNVNGHISFSNSVGIPELGCSVFCKKISGPCKASSQFSPAASEVAVYAGCLTKVDKHMNFSNPKEITKLGCETFCSSINSSKT